MHAKIRSFQRHYSSIVGALLALSACGCGTIFPPEKYLPPDLPKSELTTIKIDTIGEYMKSVVLIEVRINGKRALRQKIGDNKNISIPDVFVAAGKHDMSVMIRHKVWDYSRRFPVYNLKTISTFSAELKSGGTYLVKVLSPYRHDAAPIIELFDENTGEVVSYSRKDRYYAPDWGWYERF